VSFEPTDGIDEPTDDFELARQNMLRQFRVTLNSGEHIIIFAHYHDAGASAVGHLSFVIIDPYGRTLIDRVFSVHVWREVKEIVDPEKVRQQIADVQGQMNARTAGMTRH
jgi:hypothetical protein